MDLINEPIIEEAKRNHADARKWLSSWRHEVEIGNWTSPDSVKALYPRTSFLPDNRVVFRIKGKKYRLVVRINYRRGIVSARFFGTRAEYGRINAEEV